ncbi:hypothetical protein [Silvibacterium acidisoli]|uniref:hypothetical protein n=1 Tax=Acidobacteriaceae bacterium ZG23-2 TaxID=2883246 RepID=UPI00406C6F2F
MGPPVVDAAFTPPVLKIVSHRPERLQVVDFYEENPVGSFRGVALALIFTLVLAMASLGGWIIWKLLH